MAFDPDAFIAASKVAAPADSPAPVEPQAPTTSTAFDPDAFIAARPERVNAQEKAAVPRLNEAAKGSGSVPSLQSLMAGVNRGITGVADLPATLYNAVSEVAGSDSRAAMLRDMPVIGDTIKQATGRATPEGESLINDAMFTAGDWGAPLGALSKADTLAGVGAAAGEFIGGDIGEILGGLTGLAKGSIKAPDAPKATVKDDVGPEETDALNFMLENMQDQSGGINNIADALRAGELGNTGDLAKDRGLMAVRGALPNVSNETDAIKALDIARDQQTAEQMAAPFGQVDTGTHGSAAELAATQARQDQQAKLASSDRYAAQEVQGNQIELSDALTQVEQQSTGALQQALAAEDVRLNEQVGLSQSREQQAAAAVAPRQEAYTQAAADVAPAGQPYETSRTLGDTFDTYEKKLTTELEKPEWVGFDQHPPIETRGMYDDAVSAASDTFDMPRVEEVFARNTALKRLKDMDFIEEPKAVHGVLSEVRSAARDMKTPNADRAILTAAASRIEDNIAKSPAGAAFKQGMAATKEKHRLLGGELVKDARGGATGATLGKKLMRPSEEGADVADAFLTASKDEAGWANPQLLDDMESYMLSKVQEGAKDIDDKTLDTYGALFSQWRTERPEFGNKLDTIVAERQALEATSESAAKVADEELAVRGGLEKASTKEAERLNVASERDLATQNTVLTRAADQRLKDIEGRKASRAQKLESTVFAAFGKNPASTIESMLKGVDNKRGWERLNAGMKTPEQKAAFKAAVGEVVVKNLTELSNVGDVATRKSALKELKQVRSRLEGVLTPDEILDLNIATERTRVKDMRQGTGAASYQEKVQEVENLMASGGAAAIMAGMSSGNSLVMTGAVRRFLKSAISKKADPERIRIVTALTADPARFLKNIHQAKFKSPEDMEKYINKLAAMTKRGELETYLDAAVPVGAALNEDE